MRRGWAPAPPALRPPACRWRSAAAARRRQVGAAAAKPVLGALPEAHGSPAPPNARRPVADPFPSPPLLRAGRRQQLVVRAGNPGSGGPFAPLVVVVRNIMGVKPFNQFRGKAISLHSQGGRPCHPRAGSGLAGRGLGWYLRTTQQRASLRAHSPMARVVWAAAACGSAQPPSPLLRAAAEARCSGPGAARCCPGPPSLWTHPACIARVWFPLVLHPARLAGDPPGTRAEPRASPFSSLLQ